MPPVRIRKNTSQLANVYIKGKKDARIKALIVPIRTRNKQNGPTRFPNNTFEWISWLKSKAKTYFWKIIILLRIKGVFIISKIVKWTKREKIINIKRYFKKERIINRTLNFRKFIEPTHKINERLL